MMTRDRCRAFTLMELIVSLAITSVIALFVFSFATSLAQVWRSSESGVSTELDANIALDTIATDLESALLLEKKKTMFAVSVLGRAGGDSGDFDSGLSGSWVDGGARPWIWNFDPAEHRYGWAGSWLRFFGSQPTVNAIGYQLVRRAPFSSQDSLPRYLLHRTVARQDYTLEAGWDLNGAAYTTAPLDSSCLKAQRLRSPCVSDVILEDVVDFGVRLYVFDEAEPATEFSPKGLRLIFPQVTGAGNLDAARFDHYAQTERGEVTDELRYPDVVEIVLRVLDSVGSERLKEVEAGESELSYEAVVEKHSRLYRRMSRLPGKEPVAYVGP